MTETIYRKILESKMCLFYGARKRFFYFKKIIQIAATIVYNYKRDNTPLASLFDAIQTFLKILKDVVLRYHNFASLKGEQRYGINISKFFLQGNIDA